jgi:itaconate CoA-transferase
MLPLEGVLVIAMEQAVAAPFATRQLADLGARVIKIERDSGDLARKYDHSVDGESSYFVWCNRSKESIVLDLKDPDDSDVVERMLAEADVFIHNLAPGAVERLGFDWDRLSRAYPRLIGARISGYGPDGPYRNQKAYDLLIQGEAGLISATGTEDGPSRAGLSAADIAAGMYAYSGILTALFARERTGKGDFVEVSMLEALGEWMGAPAYYAECSGQEPLRSGSRHPYIAPYGAFPTGDGDSILLAVQNDREWANFCRIVLGDDTLIADARFATNPDRVENIESLRRHVTDVFATKTFVQVRDLLDEARIANAKMNTVKEFVNHPQLAARSRFAEISLPSGESTWAMKPPATMSSAEVRLGDIPGIGEHTTALREEFSRVELQTNAGRA